MDSSATIEAAEPVGPQRIRYREGIVGEAQRVVHLATTLPHGEFATLCHSIMDSAETETVENEGMPCLQCVARMSLLARQAGALLMSS